MRFSGIDIQDFLSLVDTEYPDQRLQRYLDGLRSNQRLGQAFMNAISGTPYHDRLVGTDDDPFHSGDVDDVLIAIDVLLRT